MALEEITNGRGGNGRATAAPGRSRNTRREAIIRAQTILMLIQDGTAWTPKRLARRLRVCERTIYRSLDDLAATGVEIVYDRVDRSYRLAQPFVPEPIQLTEEEAFALAAMCQEIGAQRQIAFFEPAAAALEKVRATLSERVRQSVEIAMRTVVIKAAASGAPDGYSDVYRKARAAIAARRVLECRYDSLSRRDPGSLFEFEPYALFFAVRAWYLVGLHAGHGAVRCLKLKRFAGIRILDKSYQIPAGFSLREHLGNAWSMIRGEPEHDVEIRVSPEFAETLSDTNWHPTQEIDHHGDGSATFRCRVAGLDEIVWWVLGHGPSVRVIRPPELAERVARLAAETAALYGGAPMPDADR